MTVWGTFNEMVELRREIDRVFQGYEGGRSPTFRRLAFLPGQAARQYPLVNLHEDKDNLYVEALAPGLDPEQLTLSVQGTTLTISGEKKPQSDLPVADYHRCERSAGKFVRSVELPYPVSDDGTAATYKQGLLLITLPKHEAAKPKQISVRVG